MKSLYRKAGVSGQAELVRVVMAGVPAFERSSGPLDEGSPSGLLSSP